MGQARTDRVGAALMLLRDGLAPFVAQRLKVALSAGLLTTDRIAERINDPDLAGRRVRDWDVAPLLRVAFGLWNEAFREVLGPGERSLVSELRMWRNRWAHQERLTEDDVDRILDSIERLLRAVGAPQAADVESMKGEFRIERYGGARPDATAVARTPPASSESRSESRTNRRPASGSASRSARSGARPAGERRFKVVCWMKPEEAEVVIRAYEMQADAEVTTASGARVEAVWYGPEHSDARKYRAGVCMLRHRSSGEARRLWIREEEARAVAESYASGSTVEFEHVAVGSGGSAVHHDDGSPEVLKYRANVMLVRFR